MKTARRWKVMLSPLAVGLVTLCTVALSGFGVRAEANPPSESVTAAEAPRKLKELETRYEKAVGLYEKGKLEDARKEFIRVRDDAAKEKVVLPEPLAMGIADYLTKIQAEIDRRNAEALAREQLKKKLDEDYRYAVKLYKGREYPAAKERFNSVASEAEKAKIDLGFFRKLELKDYLKKVDQKLVQAEKDRLEAEKKPVEEKRLAEEKERKSLAEKEKKKADVDARARIVAEQARKDQLKKNLLARYRAAEKMYKDGKYAEAKTEFQAISSEAAKEKISLGFFEDAALKDYPKRIDQAVAKAERDRLEAEKKPVEEKRLAEEKEQQRLAKEQEARISAEKKAAEEKRLAEEKETKRLAEKEKKKADEEARAKREAERLRVEKVQKALDKRYEEGQALLKNEKFEEAQKVFQQVRAEVAKQGLTLAPGLEKSLAEGLRACEAGITRRRLAAEAKRKEEDELKKKEARGAEEKRTVQLLEADYAQGVKLFDAGKFAEAKALFQNIRAAEAKAAVALKPSMEKNLERYLSLCDEKIREAKSVQAQVSAEEAAKKRKAEEERISKIQASLESDFASALKLYDQGRYSEAKESFLALRSREAKEGVSLAKASKQKLTELLATIDGKISEAKLEKVKEQEALKERKEKEALAAKLQADYLAAEKLYEEGKYPEAKTAFEAVDRAAAEGRVSLPLGMRMGLKKYLAAVDRKIAAKGKGRKEEAATEEALLEQVFQQERRAIAESLYERGKKEFDQARFDEAIVLFEDALKYNPDHADAAKYLARAKGEKAPRVTREEKALELDRQAREIERQQAVSGLEALLNEGVELESKRLYDEALEKYRLVLDRVEMLSILTPADREDFRDRASALLEKAEVRKRRAERRREAQALREAQSKAFEETQARGKAEREQLDALYIRVSELVDAKDYEAATQVVDTILRENPRDPDAVFLRSKIERVMNRYREWEDRREVTTQTQLSMEELNKKIIPYRDIVTYPSAEDWRRKTEMRTTVGGPGLAARPPEDEKVFNIMRTVRRDVDMAETPIRQAMDFFQEVYGVNILLDAKALEYIGEPQVTLKLRDVTLETVLDFVLKQYDLAYVVKGGSIFISTTDKAKEETVRATYDVKDLIIRVPDFAGPQLGLGSVGSGTTGGTGVGGTTTGTTGGGGGVGGTGGGVGGTGGGVGGIGGGGGGGYGAGGVGGTGGQGGTGGGGETIQASVSPDQAGEDLVDTIQETIDPLEWEANPAWSIRYDAGNITTNTTRGVHEKILKLLSDLRATRALQVSLEIRFVTIDDKYFQEIGFNINNILIGRLPDNHFVAGSALGTDFTTPILAPATSTFPTVGTATSGLNIPFAGIWDDIQFSMALHALQTNIHSHVMEAPRLTVFNGQRAYIAVVTQRAYVSGVSSVTAESAVGLNYTFAVLSTGVTFDVRPFISADRRYVQLTLRPSVSTLKALVDQPINLAAVGRLIEATIQLPTIEVVTLGTTVSVPDEGTLIVGGLAITGDTLNEQDVPVLGKLPIIKRFFSRKAKGTDRSNLLIFIRPEIIIQEEWEPQ